MQVCRQWMSLLKLTYESSSFETVNHVRAIVRIGRT